MVFGSSLYCFYDPLEFKGLHRVIVHPFIMVSFVVERRLFGLFFVPNKLRNMSYCLAVITLIPYKITIKVG